jgi:hypothetical protein
MSKRSINQEDAMKTQAFEREQYTPLPFIDPPLFSVTGSPIDNCVDAGGSWNRGSGIPANSSESSLPKTCP